MSSEQRAAGAFFPAVIWVLAASIDLAAAIVFGCAAYALASLFFLPETRSKELVVLD